MKASTTAVLLSGLVFPGAGQLYLQRPLRACAFMVPAAAALALLARTLLVTAHDISGMIMSGKIAPQLDAIAAEVERRGGAGDNEWAVLLLLLVWAGSALDAWLLGRKLTRS